MTGSSTQGIKTVLHPVSDLAAAKAVYTALLGISPQADAVLLRRLRGRGPAHRAGAGRWTAGHDLAGGLLAGAGHRGEAGRGDRRGRHREGTRARRRWRAPGGHLHRPRWQRPRAASGPWSDRMETDDEHGTTRTKYTRAPSCAARCRQPRSDPRARRAREQPQGHQRRDPQAPADGVHRRLRLGQELAGVRHDRRGVPAADQRDLQRLRAGLHADAGAARGRRARRADDRDHRRPGADGRRRSLHGRHRHRRGRDAAHPLQPARQAAHRLAPGVLLQCRLDLGRRGGHVRARRPHDEREAKLQHPRRHVPALRGPGLGERHRPHSALRRQQVAARGRAHDPRLQHGRLVRPDLHGLRLLRPGQAASRSSPRRNWAICSTRSRPRSRSTAST